MSVPFGAQTAAFIAKIAESVPRAITGEEMQYYIDNPKLLKQRLLVALCNPKRVAWRTVVLRPLSGEGLKEAVLNSDFERYDAHDREVLDQADLKTSFTPTTVELVTWSAQELGVDYEADKTFADIQRFAGLLGLSFCTHEQALQVCLEITGAAAKYGIPYLADSEGRHANILFRDEFQHGHGSEKKMVRSLGYLENKSVHVQDAVMFNTEIPLILVKSISGIDMAPMESVFSETVCASFGVHSKLRSRVLSIFKVEEVGNLPKLMTLSEREILRMPNMGQQGFDLIKKVLDMHDLMLRH